MSSPTKRTLAELKRRGWTAQVVERYNSFAKRRVDLFGCIDIVVLAPDGILGIQATGGIGSHAHRRAKIEAEPRMKEWLAKGGKLQIWSWNKQGARGKRKTWQLRVEEVT